MIDIKAFTTKVVSHNLRC